MPSQQAQQEQAQQEQQAKKAQAQKVRNQKKYRKRGAGARRIELLTLDIGRQRAYALENEESLYMTFCAQLCNWPESTSSRYYPAFCFLFAESVLIQNKNFDFMPYGNNRSLYVFLCRLY